MMWSAQIVQFSKRGGNLSKSISIGPNGKLINNADDCRMSAGWAKRIAIDGLPQFARLIGGLEPHQAIALGAMESDTAEIVTAERLRKLNGSANVISRTQNFINYRQRPGLALIDFDQKAMPDAVVRRIEECGGFERALASVLPELAEAGMVVRSSTSAGLYRTDTGERFPHSGGMHLYISVIDVSDSERFLKMLHARCGLAGMGWIMLGEAGQALDRSLVDKTVGQPERLVFEGAPALTPPLAQNLCVREPIVREGEALDTRACCPDLSATEMARFQQMLAAEKQRLEPEAAKKRAAFIEHHAEEIAQRAGISIEQTRRTVAKQIGGILTPSVVLPFDDPELAGKTVADVLADPERFVDMTLADPVEGVAYGRGKAKVMRGGDGRPFVHSLAHGTSTVYRLSHDFASAKALLETEEKDEVANAFVDIVLASHFEIDEVQRLRDVTSERSGVGKRTLDNKLKDARRAQNAHRAKAERQRQLAERTDPRPQVAAPAKDAEWLPVMSIINEVLGVCKADEPPVRGIDRVCASARTITVPRLSQLSIEGANQGGKETG